MTAIVLQLQTLHTFIIGMTGLKDHVYGWSLACACNQLEHSVDAKLSRDCNKQWNTYNAYSDCSHGIWVKLLQKTTRIDRRVTLIELSLRKMSQNTT